MSLKEPDARGREAEVSLTDQRVAVIVELKMRLRYNGRAIQRLAAEWEVTPHYIHNLATEANKVVRRVAADPDSVAGELFPDLMLTLRKTGRSVRADGGDPHAQAKMASSYASIATLVADIAGLKAPKQTKTELTGANGGAIDIRGPLIFTPPEADE